MKFWQVLSFSEPGQLLRLSVAAEEAGFEGVLLADHIFFPERIESKYPYSEDGKPMFDGSTPFPDPWTTMAAMSAVTERLRMATMVFILPLRSPLELAKTLGTLSLLSGGRVVLGAGSGWIREEFEILGAPWETRGARMTEMVEVMRKLWSGASVSHQGEHFRFPSVQMSPAPPAPIPVYFGGISALAMKRAARIGDGWIGSGQTPKQAAELLDRLHAMRKEFGREHEPFETMVPLVVPPELDLLKRLEAEHGMTSTSCYPFNFTLGPSSSFEQKRDQMMRFGESVIQPLSG